jgi:carbon-monoxide dehydrogenase large subunit
VPAKTNPLGVKGAGESGTVGALAPVMNAVNDALGRIGAGYLQMPATPEKVWRALQEAGWQPAVPVDTDGKDEVGPAAGQQKRQ